jgi:hypothetical protein
VWVKVHEAVGMIIDSSPARTRRDSCQVATVIILGIKEPSQVISRRGHSLSIAVRQSPFNLPPCPSQLQSPKTLSSVINKFLTYSASSHHILLERNHIKKK